MSAATIPRHEQPHDERWLAQRVNAWTTAGLIDTAQAEALVRYESDHHEPALPALRLGPIAEAGAFVGTGLALVGGAVGLGPQWGRMPLAIEIGIAAAIAIVGVLAGRILMHMGEPGAARLGGFVWLLAAAGAGLAAGTLAHELRPDSAWIAVAIGVAAAALGAATWRNEERPLQVLTVAAGVALSTAGAASLVGAATWHLAPVAMLAGAGLWAAATRWTIRPTSAVLVVAALATIAGGFLWVDLSVRLGGWLGLAAAGGVVLLGIRSQRTLVLVVGVLGTLQAVQVLVQTTFAGPAGGALVALTGLVVVAAIVLQSRRRVDR